MSCQKIRNYHCHWKAIRDSTPRQISPQIRYTLSIIIRFRAAWLPLTFPRLWRFTLEAMLTVFPTLARLSWRHIAVVALLAATLVNSSFADEAEELYLKSVKPMLAEKCFACHGVLKTQARVAARYCRLHGGGR